MWNYRICKETKTLNSNTYVVYSIREVYYNPDRSIWAVTENPTTLSTDDFGGEWDEIDCLGDLKGSLNLISMAFHEEVIDLDTIEYADRVDEVG